MIDTRSVAKTLANLSNSNLQLDANKLLEHPLLLTILFGDAILESSVDARNRASQVAGNLKLIAIAMREGRRINIADILLVSEEWMNGLSVAARIEEAQLKGAPGARTYYGQRQHVALKIAQNLIEQIESATNSTYAELEKRPNYLRRAHEMLVAIDQIRFDTGFPVELRAFLSHTTLTGDEQTQIELRLAPSQRAQVDTFFAAIKVSALSWKFTRVALTTRFLLDPTTARDISLLVNSFGDPLDWEYIPKRLAATKPVHQAYRSDFIEADPHVKRAFESFKASNFAAGVPPKNSYAPAWATEEWHQSTLQAASSALSSLGNYLGFSWAGTEFPLRYQMKERVERAVQDSQNSKDDGG